MRSRCVQRQHPRAADDGRCFGQYHGDSLGENASGSDTSGGGGDETWHDSDVSSFESTKSSTDANGVATVTVLSNTDTEDTSGSDSFGAHDSNSFAGMYVPLSNGTSNPTPNTDNSGDDDESTGSFSEASIWCYSWGFKMVHELEQYYPGDAAWSNFVSVFDDAWPTCRFQQSLLAGLGGQVDVAKVVFALTGDDAVSWIHSPAPALGGLSAADCVSGPNLVRRLRSMLMRMPI